MERRNAVRYRLQIPTVFRWQKSGKRFSGKGVTRDISHLGAYILSTIYPPLGGKVKVEIANAETREIRRSALLCGTFQVVRVDQAPSSRRMGFSVSGKVFIACEGEGRNLR